VAKEQVDPRTEALRRIGGAAKQQVLDPPPLVSRVASLDTVTSTVLKGLPVMPAPLPAPLLKEAPYGRATWVLYVWVAMGHLEPPELHDSSDIGVDSAPCKQGPFHRSRYSWYQGRRRHIALPVVYKQLCGLSQGDL
jgi:hypothetical protein